MDKYDGCDIQNERDEDTNLYILPPSSFHTRIQVVTPITRVAPRTFNQQALTREPNGRRLLCFTTIRGTQ